MLFPRTNLDELRLLDSFAEPAYETSAHERSGLTVPEGASTTGWAIRRGPLEHLRAGSKGRSSFKERDRPKTATGLIVGL